MSTATGTRLAPLFIVVAVASAVVLGGCSAFGNDAAKDQAARVDHYQQAAKTYYDGGKFEAAVGQWDKVLAERPDDQWAKFGLAKSLHMTGTVRNLRRAEAILEDLVKLDWTHPTRGNVKFEVQTTLANVYSSLSDFYDRDVRILERRLAEDPNVDAATLRTQVQRQRTIRDDLLRKSIPVWNDVLGQSPNNPFALAGLAKANLTSGSEDLGIQYAQQYVQLSRTSQVRWRQRLQDWRRQMAETGGQVTREQTAFYMEKIHGARDKEIGMHLLLGSVFMRREEFSKAVAEYDEVIGMDPALPAPYVERAQAYAALGLYRKAVQDLEQYLKMTDPQRQRLARVNAAELLERYRRLSQMAPPAPNPRLPPSSPRAWGSPD
jgi:tetratricopeptide (TPR) repeat protein